MNEDKFLVKFEDDKDIIVINDKIRTKGAFSYSISKIMVKQDYDLEVESVKIEGTLVTNFYIQELRKIESARYILDHIEVTQENYGSKEDNIVYHFTAELARVKYQIDEFEEI